MKTGSWLAGEPRNKIGTTVRRTRSPMKTLQQGVYQAKTFWGGGTFHERGIQIEYTEATSVLRRSHKSVNEEAGSLLWNVP